MTMTTLEMQQEIIRLKRKNNICILAHAYQSHDIWDIADYVGDSFGLCKNAQKSSAQTILMCGVRFMAETAKILSPAKRVLLSNSSAGCPMAEQLSKEEVLALRERFPDYAVVAYINTTSELKTVCDVCVTSSSAPSIIRRMPQDKILFIPDCNLGSWIAKQTPDKTFEFVHGGCPTHVRISVQEVEAARRAHPNAKLLMHPECRAEVVALADFVGSTTEIMTYAQKSDGDEFIIGTENSIVQHLQFACPEKQFFPLSKECICHNMKATTLADVLHCVEGTGGEEILMETELMDAARRSIDAMLAYGG